MITIDEAIKRTWEIANVDFEETKGIDKRDFEQISNWLEELKALKEKEEKFDRNIKFFEKLQWESCKAGYIKAIDDFVEAVRRKYPDDRNAITNLEIIAEQLKEGSTDNE